MSHPSAPRRGKYCLKWSPDEVDRLVSLRQQNFNITWQEFIERYHDEFPGRSAPALRWQYRRAMRERGHPRYTSKCPVSKNKQKISSPDRPFPAGVLQGYQGRVSTIGQHNPHPIPQQPGSIPPMPQNHSSVTTMQRHRQVTGSKQSPVIFSKNHEPLGGWDIHGDEGHHFDEKPPHYNNNSDGRDQEHYTYDCGYEIQRYDSQEEDKNSHSNPTITESDAHHTDQERINVDVADRDSPFPYRVESSGWIAYTNHRRPATPTPEPRLFAMEASQATRPLAETTNGLETTAELTSLFSSSSSFEAILYPCFIRGVGQGEDNDIAAILEEHEKQIADEGNNHEQQFAELRQKLIAHFEGFLEVRRQLQKLQEKALNRANRAKKVEELREELRLLDNELCPD
ncbi:hypothetical protein BDW66DRAFT_155420 [Aspergillus desertorum]